MSLMVVNPYWFLPVTPGDNLPTRTQILTMDWACDGEPFVAVVSRDSVALYPMDYGFSAVPFVSNDRIVVPNRNRLLGMDWCFDAEPFVQVPTKDAIDLSLLDYSFNAEAFGGAR